MVKSEDVLDSAAVGNSTRIYGHPLVHVSSAFYEAIPTGTNQYLHDGKTVGGFPVSDADDAETGNDYFGARYYGSTMGRFLSPDYSDAPEAMPYPDLSNPQSFNRYVYMNDNPLGGADVDGHQTTSQSGNSCGSNTGISPISGGLIPAPCNDYSSDNGEMAQLMNATAQNSIAQLAQQQSQHLSPIDKVAMKAEANAIKLTRQALAGGHAAEYGGLILSNNANGGLSATAPIHTGETSVDIDSIAVPKGFTVVGEFHTHPSTTCCDSVGPSVQDVVRLRTPENASRIGYVGDAFSGSVSRYTQREPVTGPYDTHTYGTIIGTVP